MGVGDSASLSLIVQLIYLQYSILDTFRHNLYHGCLTQAADALFDLADALACDTNARSFVELSLAGSFQRSWSSLYAALDDGRIDRAALGRLFAQMLPRRLVGQRLVLGLDTSSIARPDAHTSSERTLVYQANLPSSSTPVVPGWLFSTLVVLPDPVSSWTYILDNRRVESNQSARSTAVTQLCELLPRVKWCCDCPLLVLDRGYANAPWLVASAELATDQLMRARSNQVLYRPPPPPTGKPGRPRKDGARFKGSDASTHGQPDGEWSGRDESGKAVEVRVWHNLHLRQEREMVVSVIQVKRPRAADSKRDPKVSWFWYRGKQMPELSEIAGMYRRRFGQEHGYRFDKQDLLWATPRLRTPEQMQRWTDVVAIVHNELVLASREAEAIRRAWERRERAVTPRQVRRVMGKIIAQLGTPARAPKVRGKSPGRAKGSVGKRAPRCEVIRKSPRKAKAAHIRRC